MVIKDQVRLELAIKVFPLVTSVNIFDDVVLEACGVIVWGRSCHPALPLIRAGSFPCLCETLGFTWPHFRCL